MIVYYKISGRFKSIFGSIAGVIASKCLSHDAWTQTANQIKMEGKLLKRTGKPLEILRKL